MTSCNATDWEFILPAGDVNHIKNPSFEFDLDGFTAVAPSTIARDNGENWTGATSMRVNNALGNPRAYGFSDRNIAVVPAQTYYFRARVKGVAGETYTLTVYNVLLPPDIAGSSSVVATGGWDTITAAFATNAGVTNPYYDIGGVGASASPFYVDGVEVLSLQDATYLDGDQIDCAWYGLPHSSPSYRLATVRGGGIPVALTEYGLRLTSENGTGLRPVSYQELDRPDVPGTQTTGIKIERRVWQLGGIIKRADFEQFRTARNELIDGIAPLSVPRIDGAPQPVWWRYVGDTKTLWIAGHYEGGLDVSITANDVVSERVAVRILSNDSPLWRALPTDGALLDANDLASYTTALTFARQSGQWGAVNDTSVGTFAACVAVNGDGDVYFGGNFTSVDADATLNYAFRYDPRSGTLNSLDGGALNGNVLCLLPLPDRRIMLGGDFTDVGDANGDYVVIYDPATDSFTSLNANPLNDTVRGLALDPTTGNVILVGDFTQDAVPTTLNYVARWTGGAANFAANGVMLDAYVNGVGVRRSGQIVIAGTHTHKISACDAGTTTWYEVGNVSGADDDGYCVFVDPDDDTVFVGGEFTQFDGEDCGMVAQFGTISSAYAQWNALGSGFSGGGGVQRIVKHPDGSYRIVGDYTAVGDLSVAPKIVRWTGSVFAPEFLDLGWSTLTGVYGAAIGPDGDEWYATSLIPAAGQIAGHTVIIMPDGAAPTPPRFSIKNISVSGGVSLYGVENFTTGARIVFDAPVILDDEIIIIDCEHNVVTSTVGRRLATIAGTTPRALELLAGTNDLWAFVATSGLGTMTSLIDYAARFWSVDAAEDAD